MSFDSVVPIMNGHPKGAKQEDLKAELEKLNIRLSKPGDNSLFHGDKLLADKEVVKTGIWADLRKVLTPKNVPELLTVVKGLITRKSPDAITLAELVSSLPNDSSLRAKIVGAGVKDKYDKMLHPPLTYLGNDFQFRAPDGRFNSVLHPQLGQAGTPYAKSVPSKTHQLGALPDPGDLFDRLMARQDGGRQSGSGLSSMLIYHATIIIHDIFRTNDTDKNISDSSSYLDLSPLYGYNLEMQKKVRDDKFKLGLLKPDTFAEDRLLRQPPGVCTYLVMYNRYHNYAATQLRRINENNRFAVPKKYQAFKLVALSKVFPPQGEDSEYTKALKTYEEAAQRWEDQGQKSDDAEYIDAEKTLLQKIKQQQQKDKVSDVDAFLAAYDAAWNKLDDDLFNTARLITCGLYINISIHDYLRALMGFHQFDTTFTLDPRQDIPAHENVSRGLGNQVTVEFNLLYRFHCAISLRDEQYAEDLIKEQEAEMLKTSTDDVTDPKKMNMEQFMLLMRAMGAKEKKEPWLQEFGLKTNKDLNFTRNTITGLFDDQQLINNLKKSMNDPISNFGPRNTPKALKIVEIMGIEQARKWSVGTLNDFRSFFKLARHETFEDVTGNKDLQDALRDLYDHPDKIELYPGIFCESEANLDEDSGPRVRSMALWGAIFSDAITLVRSDRFYTVDWNTDSLTSWGMKEVTPDNDLLKSSVFHRLLQRAFPEWFPYDSLRFFHPFYTDEFNGKYAKAQGYGHDFNVTERTPNNKDDPYDATGSQPSKPKKPLVLDTYSAIKEILDAPASAIIHPAFIKKENLPPKMYEVIQAIKANRGNTSINEDDQKNFRRVAKAYFTKHAKAMIEREVITMSASKGEGPIYQIDATRDLAIPVITRSVADFLGFGDQIRSKTNPAAKYSENEIYQHITNVQAFLSYNNDETKLLKRRVNFKASLTFLLKLAEEGNVLEASKWRITRILAGCFQARDNDIDSKDMKDIGKKVAAKIVETEKDSGKAAAILLLAALDSAYISVLAFTATLEHLLAGAYEVAKDVNHDTLADCDWFRLQRLVLEDKPDIDAIEKLVVKAQSESIKTPFIRKVVKIDSKVIVKVKEGDKEVTKTLSNGDTIVCDIHAAMNTDNKDELKLIANNGHLNYISSLSANLVGFNPKDLAIEGVTALLTVAAQLKDLRRSHTNQGQLKTIQIDQSSEGYANFISPGRMNQIAYDATNAKAEYEAELKKEAGLTAAQKKDNAAVKEFKEKRVQDAAKVWSPKILKPANETYLSPEWDEMVPFPSTWKLRFEGYDSSTYSYPSLPEKKDRLLKLRPPQVPDSFPPWYQPRVDTSSGGVFGDSVDDADKKTEEAKKKAEEAKKVAKEIPRSLGCGVPVPPHYASRQLNAVQH